MSGDAKRKENSTIKTKRLSQILAKPGLLKIWIALFQVM